jgi:uncharacterized phiE125 gp8 family phage protein
MTPVRTVAPAETPVTIDQAKAHLRVEHDGDNELITALIEAATGYLDGWSGILGRALVTQTWRVDLDVFPPCRYLKLPLLPVQSIASIAYSDGANADQVFAGANYSLINGAIVLGNTASFPSVYARADAVRITFVAGYGGAAEVPAPLKQAILLHVEQAYDAYDQARQDAFDRLIAPFRVSA